jgi:hypothetical protein
MRVRSMQSRAREITIIVVVLFKKTTTGVIARSDGVPNVADEEPGVCFGKILARTAAPEASHVPQVQGDSQNPKPMWEKAKRLRT